MAPEIIELNGASTASDIWSTGCCIIELLTGKPPYADCNAMTALFRIVEDDSPPLPPNISSELTNFLSLCFQKDPLKRQTAIELLSHPWIKNQVRPNSANLLNANIKEINVNSKDGGSKLKGIERKDNDLPQPESTPNSSFKSQIGGGFSSVTSLESQKSKVPAKIDLENFSNSNLEPGSVPGSTNSLKPHGMQRIKNISKESLTLKTDPESLKRKKSPQINANSLSVTASMPVINQEKQSDQSSKQSVKKSTDKLSKREKKKDSCRIS